MLQMEMDISNQITSNMMVRSGKTYSMENKVDNQVPTINFKENTSTDTSYSANCYGNPKENSILTTGCSTKTINFMGWVHKYLI